MGGRLDLRLIYCQSWFLTSEKLSNWIKRQQKAVLLVHTRQYNKQ